jgi:hypothetical protein
LGSSWRGPAGPACPAPRRRASRWSYWRGHRSEQSPPRGDSSRQQSAAAYRQDNVLQTGRHDLRFVRGIRVAGVEAEPRRQFGNRLGGKPEEVRGTLVEHGGVRRRATPVLALLWIAALTLTVVAWFAILLTGRYARAIFDFSVGVLRWTRRVQFFGFDVLATDRYPPFSLDPDPGYPADLSIDYPNALSPRLVLVKSWLLALPHLLIALVITGVPFWVARDLPWSAVAGGLLGLLTLAAMVALSFSGRYPEGLFDLVMGLNRWVYRVLAYVLLMRDEYPPFRLDVGGTDPGTAPTTPPAWISRATPIRRKTPANERRSGIRLTIIGQTARSSSAAVRPPSRGSSRSVRARCQWLDARQAASS